MSTFTCSSCGHKGPLTELNSLTPDDLASLACQLGSPDPAGLCPACGTWCDEDKPETVALTLTVRERDTVLAALRLWEFVAKQGKGLHGSDVLERLPRLREIAADNGKPLTAKQIDKLCDRVNP